MEIDEKRRACVRYLLPEGLPEDPGGEALSIGWFDGDWYLGTVSGLVRVG